MAKYTQSKYLPLLLILPQLLITLLFFIWPAFNAVAQAFLFGDAFGIQHEFAGLVNFFDLWRDPNYSFAIGVTCIIAFAVTMLTMGIGLLLAVVVKARCRSQAIYKTLLLGPYAVAPAVAAILWRFLWQPTLGWLTDILQFFHISFNYLINPMHALLVVVITASWQQFSYNFLFFFIALRMIPNFLIEAAILDGASAWQRFWQIMFPLLAPTTFFLLVMNIIYAFFDTFGIIDVLTHGGPNNSTTTLMYKVYKDGLLGLDPGSAAAQAFILMLIIMVLTLLQFWYLEKKVHYT